MSDNNDHFSHFEKMRILVSKQATIPKLAKHLQRLNKFLEFLGEAGVPVVKTVGLALTEVASAIHFSQKKVSFRIYL